MEGCGCLRAFDGVEIAFGLAAASANATRSWAQLHDCIFASMPIAKGRHLGLVSAKSHVTPSAGTIA